MPLRVRRLSTDLPHAFRTAEQSSANLLPAHCLRLNKEVPWIQTSAPNPFRMFLSMTERVTMSRAPLLRGRASEVTRPRRRGRASRCAGASSSPRRLSWDLPRRLRGARACRLGLPPASRWPRISRFPRATRGSGSTCETSDARARRRVRIAQYCSCMDSRMQRVQFLTCPWGEIRGWIISPRAGSTSGALISGASAALPGHRNSPSPLPGILRISTLPPPLATSRPLLHLSVRAEVCRA